MTWNKDLRPRERHILPVIRRCSGSGHPGERGRTPPQGGIDTIPRPRFGLLGSSATGSQLCGGLVEWRGPPLPPPLWVVVDLCHGNVMVICFLNIRRADRETVQKVYREEVVGD